MKLTQKIADFLIADLGFLNICLHGLITCDSVLDPQQLLAVMV